RRLVALFVFGRLAGRMSSGRMGSDCFDIRRLLTNPLNYGNLRAVNDIGQMDGKRSADGGVTGFCANGMQSRFNRQRPVQRQKWKDHGIVARNRPRGSYPATGANTM